jgi:hypothetical protein
MRNVVVGSFMGFVLAAAFLAACGSGGDDAGGPVAATAPGTVKWTPLGTNFIVVTGVTLSAGETWGSTNFYDNRAPAAGDQFASFEVMANLPLGTATVEVGIMPAANGADYATDPEWLGSVTLTAGSNRRATLSNVRLPPTGFRFALRSSASSVRVLRYSMTPYNAQLQ